MQQCIIYTLLSYRSVTLSIVLGSEETTCTIRTEKSYAWRKLQMMLLVLDVII